LLEVFVHYQNFNHIWDNNPYKEEPVLVLKSRKVIVKVSYKIYVGAGAGAGARAGAAIRICSSVEPESEPKEIISAPQHCHNTDINDLFSTHPERDPEADTDPEAETLFLTRDPDPQHGLPASTLQ
jgi:hypothetical protein